MAFNTSNPIAETEAVSLSARYREVGRKLTLLFFLTIALCLFVMDMLNVPIAQQIRSKLYYVTSSIVQVAKAPKETVLGLQQQWQQHMQVLEKNRAMSQELSRYASMEQAIYALEQENRRLKQALHYATPEQRLYKTARFMPLSHRSYRNMALLDQGATQNIESGQIVMHGNQMLGRVTMVHGSKSEVMLVQDIQSRIPAVSNSSNIHAVLVGQGNDVAELELVHGDHLPQIGEIMLTSGTGGAFPYGKVLGEVVYVDRQSIYVDVSRPWSHIDYVAVAPLVK